MTQLGQHTDAKLDENMLRHFILNTIRSLVVKFKDEYGELVIACDNTNVWRKKLFPYYKANRKKAKEKSDMDWNAIFQSLNKIRSEMKEFFPYRTVDVGSCEADDIIGTLCFKFGEQINTGEKILILSADKDFILLQREPIKKKNHPKND
jgi:5'-3' exonuclease